MSSSKSEQDFEEESNASSEQLYCSSSSFNEDDSDVEDGEILARTKSPQPDRRYLRDVAGSRITRPATSLF